MSERNISELTGLTMANVERQGNEIHFTATDGQKWKLHHDQDCCESVTIDDINGELSDLIGAPILQAEEASNEPIPAKSAHEWQDYSFTWTFYKLATIKGYVTLRWYGTSNGYYSERVSFSKWFDDYGWRSW